MSKITVDAATAEQLTALESKLVTEVYGPDGQLIAGAVPLKLISAVQSWLKEKGWLFDEHVTLEELQAAEAEGGEISFEELMQRLGLE